MCIVSCWASFKTLVLARYVSNFRSIVFKFMIQKWSQYMGYIVIRGNYASFILVIAYLQPLLSGVGGVFYISTGIDFTRKRSNIRCNCLLGLILIEYVWEETFLLWLLLTLHEICVGRALLISGGRDLNCKGISVCNTPTLNLIELMALGV